MSIFKDWYEDNKNYLIKRRLLYLVSPEVWLRLHRWRKQRANRGWSDRDVWNAGDHIAKITAEMLQDLNDHSYCDWPEWFKLNVKEEGKGAYKNLQQVINDINNYLEFAETTWGEDLTSYTPDSPHDSLEQNIMDTIWYDKKGKKVSEQRIKILINKHADKEMKLYKKATKAMQFFGRHFTGFWD